MKLTSQEEYGLRCLLQVARRWPQGSITIPEISRLEGISQAHAAKLLHLLRQSGFVRSARGQTGGYTLAAPPDKIVVQDLLNALGGRIYQESFCRTRQGRLGSCTHVSECSLRPLWRSIQNAVDRVLANTTLKDLLEVKPEETPLVRSLEPAPTPVPR